jgi:hypothetical protein
MWQACLVRLRQVPHTFVRQVLQDRRQAWGQRAFPGQGRGLLPQVWGAQDMDRSPVGHPPGEHASAEGTPLGREPSPGSGWRGADWGAQKEAGAVNALPALRNATARSSAGLSDATTWPGIRSYRPGSRHAAWQRACGEADRACVRGSTTPPEATTGHHRRGLASAATRSGLSGPTAREVL